MTKETRNLNGFFDTLDDDCVDDYYGYISKNHLSESASSKCVLLKPILNGRIEVCEHCLSLLFRRG